VTAEAPPVAGGLLAALLAFQAEAPTLPKDKVNPHFGSRFTSLETIVETIGPLLSEHDLIWSTLPVLDENGQPILAYRLTHVPTGQSIEGAMGLLGAGSMQQLGSAITYARRYALTAVLNLVADEDDDGEAAASDHGAGASSTPPAGTVNLQNEAKGLRNEAINECFRRVGLPPQEKPWGQLGRIPENQADAMRDALKLARTAA
jgi:ERF superfamily